MYIEKQLQTVDDIAVSVGWYTNNHSNIWYFTTTGIQFSELANVIIVQAHL